MHGPDDFTEASTHVGGRGAVVALGQWTGYRNDTPLTVKQLDCPRSRLAGSFFLGK